MRTAGAAHAAGLFVFVPRTCGLTATGLLTRLAGLLARLIRTLTRLPGLLLTTLAWALLLAATTLLLAALLTARAALTLLVLTLLVLTLLVLTLLILIPVLRHLIHSSTTFESVSEEQRFRRTIVPHRGAA